MAVVLIPPETYNVNVTGVEDQPSVTVPLSGSDDGVVTSFRVVISLPQHGVLKDGNGNVLTIGSTVPAVGNGANVFFYPDANWSGVTTFQYAARDNSTPVNLQDSTPATVTITITPVNDPPTTADTSASGLEDAAQILVTLTGADSDGTVQSFTINDLPANGTLKTTDGTVLNIGDTVPATGGTATVVFVPNEDWNGVTTFHYASKDNENLDDATPATATITVTPVADPPETNDTHADGQEDTPVAISLTGSDVDGTVASFTIKSLPDNGVLKDANGNVLSVGSTVPATGNAATVYFHPNAQWHGDTEFDYASKDNTGLDDETPATATITIADVNDPPETADTAASGVEDAPSITVHLSGSDIDGTVQTFTIKSLPANGTLTDLNGNPLSIGSTVTATDGQADVLFKPNANWTGDTSFNYASNDDDGLQDPTPAIANINVTPVNDPPETANTSASGAEDGPPIAVNLTGTDVDGTVKLFTINSLPENGVLKDGNGNVLSVGSTVTATGNGATVYFTPNANWNGDTSFDYASQDNEGLDDATPATATITVTSVNDAPDTGNSAATGVKGAVNIGLTLTGTDSDGTVVSFTIKSLPADGVIKDANGNTLTVGSTVNAVNGQAEVFFTPSATFTGVVNFNYASNDNEGLQDATPATGTVTITPPPAQTTPKPPETNNTSATGLEDVVKLPVTLTGSDPDGTVTKFVINTLPPNGKLYDAAGNLLSVGSTVTATGNAATVYFTPNANWNGVTTFNFASRDNDNQTDATPAKATITITGVNDGPNTCDVCVSANECSPTVKIGLSGSDIDGKVVSFVINSVPSGGVLKDANGNTLSAGSVVTANSYGQAAVYFTPSNGWDGTTTFKYAAKDNGGAVDSTPATVTIKVPHVNDRPDTIALTATGAEDGSPVSLVLKGTDVDGTVKYFKINSLPTGGVLKNGSTVVKVGDVIAATGNQLTLTFVANANWNGSTTFQYSSKDNDGAYDSTPATGKITITGVNDGPDAINDTASVNAGSSVKLAASTLLSNDKDVDGDTLTITSVGGATKGTVALGADGAVTFTAGAGQTGQGSFTYTISDGKGGTDTATVTVDIKTGSSTPSAPTGSEVHSASYWAGNQRCYDGEVNSGIKELLYKVDTNADGTADNNRYLLIGDFNKNGVTDNGEHTLLISKENAVSLLSSNSSDAREILGKELVAAWLNYLNGTPIGTTSNTGAPAWYIKEAVDFLSQAAGTNKTLANGVVNSGSMNSYGDFNGTDLSVYGNAWNNGYNLDGTSGVQSSGKDVMAGETIEDMLELYNNYGKIGSTIWANND
jgi:hypothetical protein